MSVPDAGVLELAAVRRSASVTRLSSACSSSAGVGCGFLDRRFRTGLVLAILTLADEFGPQLTLLTAHLSPPHRGSAPRPGLISKSTRHHGPPPFFRQLATRHMTAVDTKTQETSEERERLLSRYSARDRWLIEDVLKAHPTPTAAETIEHLEAAGGL